VPAGGAGGNQKVSAKRAASSPYVQTEKELEEEMNIITALAIVIGALAAAATWLCLGTSLGLQVWALFVGWGSFYHCGGKEAGLKNSAVNHIWGALVAAVALFIVGKVAGSVTVTSIIVGVSVVVLVLGAHLPLLSTIPAGVYGYASTAAFALLTAVPLIDFGAVGKAAAMVVVSMIIGNVFGYVSEKGAGAIAKS
jgi:Protein of unknown function (DUF1097)